MTTVGSPNVPLRYMTLRYATLHFSAILQLTSYIVEFTWKVLTGCLHAAQEVDLGDSNGGGGGVVFVLDGILPGHSMSTEHSLYMLSWLKREI